MTSRNSRTPRNRRPAAPGRRTVAVSYQLPNGETALYVGTEIRQSDPPAVREGLRRRRILVMEGRCPCGAAVPFSPAVVSPGVAFRAVTHAADCPAAEETLNVALRQADRRAA